MLKRWDSRVNGLFLTLRHLTRPGRSQSSLRDEQPLRSELFSTDQLAQHAHLLARRHVVDTRSGPDQLLDRLEQNKVVLFQAQKLIVETIAANRRMSPADEWLLDNFYLIEEQIRTARRHLPKHYSSELPRLLNGASAGFPRVYDIALELISHVDARITAESLASMVAAYQTITPLTLGELWAIPIMLRLALIENLRRVAARMTAARRHRDQANSWADRMIAALETDAKDLILAMADMARADPAMDSEFAAEFARRLQDQPQAMALPLMWLEQRLAERAITVEQLMQAEGQQQAADQVSLGNSIGSLRFLAAMDWRKFVESLSWVEQILRGESPTTLSAAVPGQTAMSPSAFRQSSNGSADSTVQVASDVYAGMDFKTRDRYRHGVERIAKHGRVAEWQVAT